ncbi:MAG: methyltransferase domain-containing protein [Candidatus Omnitrophica bacterium]|nr:methyltransferase domain-containing protein [Candidatus Omnitrophota bacterium]
MANHHLIQKCRICSASRFFPYLDLGISPLANSYIPPSSEHDPEYQAPLALWLCEVCGLSQLSCVVNPDLMFRQYLYVSSTPQTFREHCAALAGDVTQWLGSGKKLFAVDVASNDGCLLRAFKNYGFQILGVDPAKNLAAEANAAGVPTLCDYWSVDVAQKITRQYGRPDVITGTNVFAHVDDLRAFVNAVAICLADKGIFLLEFPYILDFIERGLFDTVYHEHLSYLGLGPVNQLLQEYGMETVDVKRFSDLHGGTLRIIAAKKNQYPPRPQVAQLLNLENHFGLTRREPYIAFARAVEENKKNLVDLLNAAKRDGRRVWGYGASAKGNTLLNYYGIDRALIERIVDDNPKKCGLLAPGSRIPIVGIAQLKKSAAQVDDLLLLAWNFGKEIEARAAAAGYQGDFIYPVPAARKSPSLS